MKALSLKKKIILSITILLIAILSLRFMIKNSGANQLVVQMTFLIRNYIVEKGEFPQSQDDLENCESIKIADEGDGLRFFIRRLSFDPDDPNSHDRWNPSIRVKTVSLFNIAYGADLANLTIAEDRLVNKDSGEEVLLIDGPYGTEFPSLQIGAYEWASKTWYYEYKKCYEEADVKE